MTTLTVDSHQRRQLIDVTAAARRAVAASGVAAGALHLFVPHTTAAITINENADPDVVDDLLAAFDALVPAVPFRHGEGNSDAHLLSTLVGVSLTVPIVDGRLLLGTWQGLYLCEFDGPRRRSLHLSIRPA